MSIAPHLKNPRLRKNMAINHKDAYFWKAVNAHFDNPSASTAEYLNMRAKKVKEIRK